MAPSMLCAESQTCSGSLLKDFRSLLTAGAREISELAVKEGKDAQVERMTVFLY